APGAERVRAEAAREALRAREADAMDLAAAAVEDAYPGPGEDLRHLGRLSRLVVVIPEHRHDRDARGGPHHLGEHARLFGRAVVGEIAAEKQHVGLLARRGE